MYRTAIPWGLALLLAGCPRPIPPHLQLDPEAGAEAEAPVLELSGALARVLDGDPLARQPRLLDEDVYGSVEGLDAVYAWQRAVLAVERRGAGVTDTMQQVEDQGRGTASVALCRGYRLHRVQRALASGEQPGPETQEQVLELLTPLQGAEVEEVSGAALAWLERDDMRDATLELADQWVLAGWLDGPGIPLAPVAVALEAAPFDALRASPMGRLVLARAAAAEAATPGSWDHLERATALALHRAAADRDREQAAWSELRAAEAAALGVEGDPVTPALERAFEGLVLGAASDREAGGALLAAGALRWTCELPSCGLLDRVDALYAASRWHEDVRPLAHLWRVVALKEALDSMDAGRETVLFRRALVDLVDALLGTGAGPLPTPLLARRTPDERTWMALGRAVGAEATTDWASARVVLGEHLEREARHAHDLVDDPVLKGLLERIARRAVR